jgi:hypothetical protein
MCFYKGKETVRIPGKDVSVEKTEAVLEKIFKG